MDEDEEIKGDRQYVLVELLGELFIHELFGDPEARDNKKQHKCRQDPAAITVDRGYPIQHFHVSHFQ